MPTENVYGLKLGYAFDPIDNPKIRHKENEKKLLRQRSRNNFKR